MYTFVENLIFYCSCFDLLFEIVIHLRVKLKIKAI